MNISLPPVGKLLNWRSGLFTVAAVLAGVSVSNTLGARAYSAGPEVDQVAEISGWLMAAVPGILSVIIGAIGTACGASPEFVESMRNFARNPSVAEAEKRAVNAAVEFLLPRLSKYPELLLAILRSVAPEFSGDKKVSAPINELGKALAENFLSPALHADDSSKPRAK